MARFEDLTGNKYGRLTPIEYKIAEKRWLCLCDCGTYKLILPPSLKKGGTRSCGCLKSELARDAHTTHGMSQTKAFNSWVNMMQRCLNPNNKQYHLYGGRGITVCDRWKDSFENFHKDMGNPAEKGRAISLDRIDVNGNYEPSNCRWANQTVQCNNKRNSKTFTFEGQTHSLTDWAKIKGMSYYQLVQRVNGRGWSFEEAITISPRGIKHPPRNKTK